MIKSELMSEVNDLFDLANDPNFNASDLIDHAIRWYSGFARKNETAVFTVTSGTKSYTFTSAYDHSIPSIIIDDDDRVLYPYSVYNPNSNGDFYTLPSGDSFKIVFKNTPNRTRNTALLYSRPIKIPTSLSDTIDVPDHHLYAINYFIQALSESQKQVEYIWGGFPSNYEAYFLGQLGDQVRRSWERCVQARKQIESEIDTLNTDFIVNWDIMTIIDETIPPIMVI